MIDREVVPPPDGAKHGCDNVLRDIFDPLAARADEVVMMLGVAGDVGRYVAVAFEPARHPVLDLLLERAVNGRAADRWMRRSDPVVELLRR